MNVGTTSQVSIRSTRTRATFVLGALTLALFALLVVLGLVIAKPDVDQLDAARLLFVHVPAAEMAYVAYITTAVCSLFYLWPRTRSNAWDRVAGASAEIGSVLIALTLLTGMLWGKITWGAYWTWDARLTSTALLLVMFLGYLAVRQLDVAPDVRRRRAAVVALVAAVDVPIVHFSVQWWRTQHQAASLTVKGALEGTYRLAHGVGFVAFLLAYIWLMMHRNRVAMLQDILEARRLDDAIAERRDEAAATATADAATANARTGMVTP
jgi:heme exporter protein C